MDVSQLNVLLIAAVSIAFFHTLFGPDHYLPFIVLGKSRKWSIKKTIGITLGCGLGHILGSVILGLIGIAAGIAIHKLEFFESVRGSLAGWLLIAFGLSYFVWGMRKAIKNKAHQHWHKHSDGTYHQHLHNHHEEHAHVHDAKASLAPWTIFIIFVLGPCEPLIPLLMYPAAKNNYLALFLVVAVFGLVTLATMLGMVLIALFGFNFLPLNKLNRFSHALAGFAILMCGLAMQFLGL